MRSVLREGNGRSSGGIGTEKLIGRGNEGIEPGIKDILALRVAVRLTPIMKKANANQGRSLGTSLLCMQDKTGKLQTL